MSRHHTDDGLSPEAALWLEAAEMSTIASDPKRSPAEREGASLYYRYLVDQLPHGESWLVRLPTGRE